MLVSQYHKSDMIEPRTAVTHRRQLLVALATGLIGHSVMFTRSALAQQAAGGPGKVWRVGIVPGGLYAPRKYQWDVFFGQMQTLGYVDGKNVHYEIRAPEKEGASFDDPINALVNLKVDVIVATGNRAGVAARRIAPNMPVVLSPAQDAASEGLVASLGRPGGNITGISIQMEESTGRRMQLLREMVPKAKRMAVFWRHNTKAQLDAARDAARQLKLDLLPIEVATPEAMPAAFEAVTQGRADGLVVTQDPFFFGQSKIMGELALKHKLPSIHGLAVAAAGGGLMAYGPNDTDYYRIAAQYVDKILRGAKPADLPLQQPTRWELVINMKTAKALGIDVPKPLLLQAERLID